MKSVSISTRNNIKLLGPEAAQPILFAHGYGCDQSMWRLVTPAFEDDYRLVLFDHVGFGNSEPASFDPTRYGTLHGYARDVLEICQELKLKRIIFVGHSVSAMVGVLAAKERPELFDKLVFVGPSPCYINDGDYVGGFTKPDIDGLLDFLDSNYVGWSTAMAPVIMQNPERPELSEELANSFCRADPEIAKHFAKITFLSDNRADLPSVTTPTVILQSDPDSIAPVCVGEYVRRHISNSSLVMLKATGHCPHLSAPAETISAIKGFLNSRQRSRGHSN